jgi:hypothetical protein
LNIVEHWSLPQKAADFAWAVFNARLCAAHYDGRLQIQARTSDASHATRRGPKPLQDLLPIAVVIFCSWFNRLDLHVQRAIAAFAERKIEFGTIG